MHDVLIVASTEEASVGLFEALGLNATLLIQQAIAFLILVAVLGKFVYPALVKAIDSRREQIEAGMREAKEAEEALVNAEAKVADMLVDARKEADEIIARTQQEANALVSDAEEKAKTRAEQIVKDARAQLDTDIIKARRALKEDTIQLVAMATEKIVGEKLDERKDAALIKEALQEKA